MLHLLSDIVVRADQDLPRMGLFKFEVLQDKDRFVILEEGEQVAVYDNPEKALLYLHEWINYRVYRATSDLLKIHAGCASFRGKRVILAGDKATGKTTLLCRLLLDGMTVHSDEHVLLDNLETLPFPRKFHLKEASLALVPELVPICTKRRSYPSYFGGRFYFFDPLDAGHEWKIKKDRLDVIVYLEPDHGKSTTMKPCPKYLMVHSLMRQTDNFSADPGVQIRELCRLVDNSACYTLRLGKPEDASKIIHDLLS
ncbi:MAG: hypothetical protein CVU57_29335 [Deltaproteobacteria bacterium HGW-Deltaproteobacteria-15]|nr:MAG: hypothetical protein CVU57_29335 [Deltaproteobacteria bacterium HGW-Deltaproteobacteria-15]